MLKMCGWMWTGGSLWTQSYEETVAMPEMLRRAKALKKTLEEIPIYIKEGELIVGGGTAHPRNILCTVELSDPSTRHTLEDFYVREDQREEGARILDYWEDKNMWSRVKDIGQLDESHLYNAMTGVMAAAATARDGMGSSQPDYEFVFRTGLKNVIKRLDEKLAHAVDDVYGPQVEGAIKRSYQWRAMKIAAQAAMDWG